MLVVIVPPQVLAPANLDGWWGEIFGAPAGSEERQGRPDPVREIEVVREENGLQRFVTIVRSTSTFVICALQGEILLPFLAPALACDYRVLSEETVFINRCLDTGMPPCGALPWFLSRFVGMGKTFEILFEKESLTADEALELGLANRVIEAGRLESLAIARAEWFASKPAEGLAAAKRMMTAAHWCLGSCFGAEEKAFQWCMSRKHAAERR
ncbi:MAG: enoyl-CoA hydratase/isomerase family protein [Halothiobacillaceae bacterium]